MPRNQHRNTWKIYQLGEYKATGAENSTTDGPGHYNIAEV